MANPEHLEIIQKGTAAWNEWRASHPTVWPDLLGAALPTIRLDEANLENVNLSRVDLEKASLVGAHLRNSNLRGASLINANLTGADLQEANLYGARLAGACLERTMLRHANLLRASFDRTNLAFATFGSTSFDHGLIEGGIRLGTIYHDEPSIVDVQIFDAAASFLRRKPHLTRSTLWLFQDAGIPEQMLDAFRETPEAKRWYSCFVSYGHSSDADRQFVEKLCERLEEKRVPFWQDNLGLSYGAFLEEEIAGAINHYDRTLACCSRVSLASDWVNRELAMVVAKEKQVDRAVLLPLDVDGCLLDDTGNQELFKFSSRLIADFRKWQEPTEFDKAIDRLFKALNPAVS